MTTPQPTEAVKPREAFEYCPRCANPGNIAPIEATYFDCGSCGFRFHFNATVSASALIERTDGTIFFIRRAREPAKGKLAYPGGFVDSYERVEDALLRETREEVGMEVREFTFLGSWINPYRYRGIIYPVADLFFVVRVTGETTDLAHDEVESAAWLDPRTVYPDDLAFPSMREALKAYTERIPSG